MYKPMPNDRHAFARHWLAIYVSANVGNTDVNLLCWHRVHELASSLNAVHIKSNISRSYWPVSMTLTALMVACAKHSTISDHLAKQMQKMVMEYYIYKENTANKK